jgi:thioredoxin reductase (NADPH)
VRQQHFRAVADPMEKDPGAGLVACDPVKIRTVSPVRREVRLIGRRLGAEETRLRDFLTRGAQPYEWLEAGTPEADRVLAAAGIAKDRLPALVWEGGTVAPATLEEVAGAWRIRERPRRERYDLIIVGAGPAGLAAAVYAASDGLSTLVVEKDTPGGQASYTSMIENFFGFPDGIGGAELARLAGRQAERFGAELAIRQAVTGGGPLESGRFEIAIDDELRVEGTLAIACPGMEWRRLEVDGIEELLGHGVQYGAGRSEAMACRDSDVVVVGAGNSAGQAAAHMASIGARVELLVRGEDLGSSMSAYLVERIEASPQIAVRLRTEVEGVEAADGRLAAVGVRGESGAVEWLRAEMMFVCIGGRPRTGWAAKKRMRTDAQGYVITGPDLLEDGRRPDHWPLERDPLPLETSVPGLFVAGDARYGSIKRVGGAVGEGAMAVALAERRLEELRA